MQPVRTERTNRVFQLLGSDESHDLPLEATTDGEDNAILVSTWELSDEERQWIAQGAKMELAVWGTGHPPVSLIVTFPEDIEDGDGDS